jgi:CRISPR-associated endonuclease Cas1/CRISPR-associated protein Cas4
MSDESLWPARNVAEHAYCARLFYLMEVEGVHLPSVDTEEGQSVHANVDAPGASAPPPGEDRPTPVRSLVLTSKALGLTATLDLAEFSGGTAVPVEYRKGRPRRPRHRVIAGETTSADQEGLGHAQPWPTDRVQLGLQAILLEESGYVVSEGVLYYASERLRLRVAIDDAIKKEALNCLRAARTTAAADVRPPPLVNDPRCDGCSLQPFCLPDEIAHQRAGVGDSEELTPRKLWPPLADGLLVVAQTSGAAVGVRGECLRVAARGGEVLREVPLAQLESLMLLGSVQLSTQAIHALADLGRPVAWCSAAGRLTAMLDPLDSVSALVRRAQVRKLDIPSGPVELARSLLRAKLSNQRTLLLRNHSCLPGRLVPAFDSLCRDLERAADVPSLRGIEGAAAALYFGEFHGMLREPFAPQFQAHGRQRRPPPDPVNAVLSLAYSLLTHECVTALRLARLEPSIGALHVSRPGRPALALDLMEPFRPLIADSLVLTAFNKGEFSEGHFASTAAGCALTDHGRRVFFRAYARRMETEVTHSVFDYRLTYRRMLHLHARLISAWFLDEVHRLAFLETR